MTDPSDSAREDSKSLLRKDNSFPLDGRRRARNKQSSAQHVSTHMRQRGVLMHLVQQTDKLVRLHRIMRAFLPPHLQDHARLSAADEDGWIIATESSAWATRLRYELPVLRQQLAAHLKRDLPPFKLKVEPVSEMPSKEPRRLKLTQNSASVIEGAADSVNDERLGAALMRLAAHARKAS